MDEMRCAEDPDPSVNRSASTSLWRKMGLAAKRIRCRGRHGVATTLLRDQFPGTTFVLVLLLLVLTLADAILTLLLLQDRFEEANPAMKFLLQRGPTAFVVGKYLLTVVGLPILLIFRRRNVFSARLRVEHILPTLVAFYVVLLIYQLSLLSRI